MFETTPPQPVPDGFDPETLADDLFDPVGGVVAVELSRRFVRLCLSWSEPMAADLAAQSIQAQEATEDENVYKRQLVRTVVMRAFEKSIIRP